MNTIFSNLLQLFYPRLCVSCQNKLSDYEEHICLDCLTRLPKTYNHMEEENHMERFLAGRIPFERVAAFSYFVHGGIMQDVIHELKYHRNAKLGKHMGEMCGNVIKGSVFMASIDLIIPIPLHPKRLRERGYNQSLEIAKGISNKTGVKVDDKSVIRTKNNPAQAKTESRFDRWTNVENIFSVVNPKELDGKHILLLDDVMTTGSTLESCAKEILQHCSCKISIYSLATVSTLG